MKFPAVDIIERVNINSDVMSTFVAEKFGHFTEKEYLCKELCT